MRSAMLSRILGGRTAAYGIYTLAQPHTLAKVACDVGDPVDFGLWASPRSRTKVMTVATGWGFPCAASYSADGRTR